MRVKFDAKELISGLGKLASGANPAVAKIVKANASELQRNEMRDVPVDTGFLKGSITLETENEGLTASVEPTADYASWVEYGTRFMSAQPYVRPNFNEQSERFKNDMEKLVK